jgi:selenocysteine-specific translation elongation factor
MVEELIGTISDYFVKPSVAGIDLSGTVKVGDRIRITGHTTDIEMVVHSMQIEHQNVQEAGAGDSVGIEIPDRARRGDSVYKISE